MRILPVGMRGHSGRDEVPCLYFFFSSRRRHTRLQGDWSSDVCSSDLRRQREARRSHTRRTPESPVQERKRGGAPTRRPACFSLAATSGCPSLSSRVQEIGRASCRERV